VVWSLESLLMHTWHLARGFRYAGVHSGLRPDPQRRDLALIVSDVPASAAGVFTRNRVQAAPVHVCRERLPMADGRGVVICSGNANACTGQRGLDDARTMTALAAEAIGCQPEQMLVCSTGVIGRPLPMPVIESGIRLAATHLGPTAEHLDAAAHSILTTDTVIKVVTRTITIQGRVINLTGMAKGAAMIGPNMATMLAFVFTDACVAPRDLGNLAVRAADETFNCVSVEGHTSTNDSLLFLANGLSQPVTERAVPLTGPGLAEFNEAALSVCSDLARAIATDAEGATRLVVLDVEGLRDNEEARTVARTVANSALVKTAIFGADPNWGRIISAAGYAGIAFEEKDLSLWMGDMLLYHNGTPLPFDPATASAYLKRERTIHLRLKFTLGTGRCTFYTCDLTYEYVKLNADYTT
jgi:glutamate N-acetyltransferase / amino-acid N-acetyltransferase